MKSLFARGALAALVLASSVGCVRETETAEGNADEGALTNVDGDRRDPASAAGDRVGATSEVWGRKIALHISDRDNMAWGSIDNGTSDDQVWLDRSFDGGIGWGGGSKVGITDIPSGGRSWRTMMYNIDDPGRHGVGAVRACGKAHDRGEVTCTPWFRSTVNAGTRLDAAATALMQFYDFGDGLWRDAGWWNSANALTALIDYSQATGSTTYRYAIGRTFDENKRHNFFETNFTNEFMDDTGWWGLAWVRAFDLTGEQRYLDMAKKDADYMWSYKDDTCGGGVWWKKDRKYKNAITNELFIKLAAAIHNRVPGDTQYLSRAQEDWRWFAASGMINGQAMINDGLDNCRNNNGETWTYNQGVILGALVELNRATGDASYLEQAQKLADASTVNQRLNPGGVLREPCEDNADACGGDGVSFKGIYVRNLGELDRALPSHPYHPYLARQAEALDKYRTTLDQYGVRWGRPVDKIDPHRQQSALDALTAAR
jgi:predicted alpha-1,6-mannanase (GH76 family)